MAVQPGHGRPTVRPSSEHGPGRANLPYANVSINLPVITSHVGAILRKKKEKKEFITSI